MIRGLRKQRWTRAMAALVVALAASATAAQTVPQTPDNAALQRELWRLQRTVQEQSDALAELQRRWKVQEAPELATPPDGAAQPSLRTTYDRGLKWGDPDDPGRFALQINAWMQFRHHAFSRDALSWTDRAGRTRPLMARNALDVERGRLVLRGHAGDPRLTYFLQLDGDTDDGHAIELFDYWWSWRFSDAAEVQFGKRKVSAGRQWLVSGRHLRLVDRPMANDFFRPDRTVGVFLVGDLAEATHYELTLGAAYRSANLSNAQLDDRFTFAATVYSDPWGDFGSQLTDVGGDDGRLRVGQSFAYSPQTQDAPGGELSFLRLSDGTRVANVGALAAGVTVSEFDVFLYGVDVAWKRDGWSGGAELFLRWIESIGANGPLPDRNLFQHGFYVEGGRFVIPSVLDINARWSQVFGIGGTASEAGLGANWYPTGKAWFKASFDVTWLDGSPLQNTASDLLVGDQGVLFRTQVQAEF